MTQDELNEALRKHKMWLDSKWGGECADLRGANLRDANLRDANLRGADLRGANLSDANWDYSCFPLWRGGSHFKTDMRLIYQLLAHISTLECEDSEFAELRALILPYAKKSHRAEDLGLLEDESDES